MAAEVSRAVNNVSSGGRKTSSREGRGSEASDGKGGTTNDAGQGGGKKSSRGRNATDRASNIDIQQIMAIAMAAAASMNSADENAPRSRALSFDDFGLEGRSVTAQEGDDSSEVDDDVPPEI